jgi:HSP20 family molecular chaperone IbpA
VIARRAYELFEGHGSVNGHDIDDWIEAKVEVVREYRHDLKKSAEAIVFKAELPCSFTTDQLNVSVEPRRLMLSGETELDVIRGGDTPAHVEKRTQRIFGVEELPVDVDPSRATATLKGDVLEIVRPRVTADSKSSGKSKAA